MKKRISLAETMAVEVVRLEKQITKLRNQVEVLEKASDLYNPSPKTCGTCRYPIRFSFREYVCWRHNDGKTRYDVLGSTPACDKHKEIT